MPSKQVTNNDNAVYTTSNGAPVARPYAAEKISPHGPLLLQGECLLTFDHVTQLIFATPDFHHIDLLAHFDRERIPERVVCIKILQVHSSVILISHLLGSC